MTAFSAASIASSVAGTTNAEQVAKADRKRAERPKETARRLENDEVELHQVEAAEAVRSLKNNTDEDATEDHQEHPAYYHPNGTVQSDEGEHRIDLSG